MTTTLNDILADAIRANDFEILVDFKNKQNEHVLDLLINNAQTNISVVIPRATFQTWATKQNTTRSFAEYIAAGQPFTIEKYIPNINKI